MADMGTPLRSGSLVRFTASTESLSVMEVEGGEMKRMEDGGSREGGGTERMEIEDGGSIDMGEEGGTRSRESSGICPLREEEPI